MGQTLSEPITKKESLFGGDEDFIFGLSSMQGWRISMEDAHLVDLNLSQPSSAGPKLRLFAVFDGHGGERVAQFCGENLSRIFTNTEEYEKGNYVKALEKAFLDVDKALLADDKFADDPSGCTATAVLLGHQNIVYCANAGDSRTVIGIKGIAKPLSFDHKPQNELEKERICQAGGFVDFGRVNGNLALSRAIGDFEFKQSKNLPPEKQIVTAFPDVVEHIMNESDEFIVLACDGIWDCKTSQEVIEFVRRGIAAQMSLDKIAENLMDNCISSTAEMGGVGCDNMTVIIVGLLRGKTEEEWYRLVSERVVNKDGPSAPPSAAKLKGPPVQTRLNDGKSLAERYLLSAAIPNVQSGIEDAEGVEVHQIDMAGVQQDGVADGFPSVGKCEQRVFEDASADEEETSLSSSPMREEGAVNGSSVELSSSVASDEARKYTSDDAEKNG